VNHAWVLRHAKRGLFDFLEWLTVLADPTANDLAAGRLALDAATMISTRRWPGSAERRGAG
jgi:hypothetical protein